MEDGLLSLTKDFGEVTLDSFMPDGIIKELPIIGSAFSVLKNRKRYSRQNLFGENKKFY